MPTGWDRSCASTAPSSRSGMTSTGPGSSASTSRPPAAPVFNLAFFSGNEVFWKTRWEDGYRTLVSYKATHGTPADPSGIWTGTYRDGRVWNPEGANPENSLTGTSFEVNFGTSAIEVPASDGDLRLWRNTSVASLSGGQAATLPDGTLGYEWDEDMVNDSRPPGLVRLSTTERAGVEVLIDEGSRYGVGAGDTPPHPLPPRQRRARLRRRHGPVVVGARQPARSRRQCHEHRHAAGDGEPLRGHERPARCAAVRSGSRGRVCGRDTTDGSGVGPGRAPAVVRPSAVPRRMRGEAGSAPWRFRRTTALPGVRPRDARTGATPGRRPTPAVR